MPRIARIVVPEIPHHITQRGNRRQPVFFSDKDMQNYLETIDSYAKRAGIRFWAFCLMKNHVHFIAVPKNPDSFAKGLGEAQRRYSRRVNFREGWRGHLWQGRFSSYPLDERHLYFAIRYVERNPVRATLVDRAEDYPWSSARAHVNDEEHFLLDKNYFTQEIPDWSLYLSEPTQKELLERFRKHTRTGRPLGNNDFIKKLEGMTGLSLMKQKPGPKRQN